MTEWKSLRKTAKARVGELATVSPALLDGYRSLAAASNKTVHLDGGMRELIALAVAVTTRCEGCIAAHVEAAIREGLTREQIVEALGVAIALNAGAALTYSGKVLDCLAEMSAA